MKEILFALFLVGAILAQDLREALPEEAQRRGPKPVYVIRTVELVFESLDSVMAQSDLVLLGRVVQISPRLSADQKDIFTDYSIQPLRQIWPQIKAAPLATRGYAARKLGQYAAQKVGHLRAVYSTWFRPDDSKADLLLRGL